MATIIDIRDLPGRLTDALETMTAGGEILVADGPTLRARLVPISASPRIPDLHPGAITTTEDFDDPLPDDFWTGRP